MGLENQIMHVCIIHTESRYVESSITDTNSNVSTYVYVVLSRKKGYDRKIILTFMKRTEHPMRLQRDAIYFHKKYGYYRVGALTDFMLQDINHGINHSRMIVNGSYEALNRSPPHSSKNAPHQIC